MPKRPLRLLALAVLLACGLSAGVLAGLSRGSSVPTGTLTEGQTLHADPSTMVDTAKAVTLIDSGESALCKTTITGVGYFANPSAYVGGQWHRGLSALTLAQSISPAKSPYDTAGNALMLTTITGKKYCLNPAKWPSGQWALAFSTLASERADLVANPAQDGPSIR